VPRNGPSRPRNERHQPDRKSSRMSRAIHPFLTRQGGRESRRRPARAFPRYRCQPPGPSHQDGLRQYRRGGRAGSGGTGHAGPLHRRPRRHDGCDRQPSGGTRRGAARHRRRRSDPDRDGQVYYWLFTAGEPLGQDVADRAAAIAAARTGVLAAELPGLRGDDPGDPAELRYTPTAHRDLGFQGQAGRQQVPDKSG